MLAGWPQAAEAGLGCVDACGPASPEGDTCLSIGLGCNPFTRQCERCNGPAADDFCEPGGRCVDGVCVDVMCGGPGVDAGFPDVAFPDGGPTVDAGTSTGADAGSPDTGAPADDGGLGDAGMMPTATVADAGPIDTGIPPEDPNRTRSSGSDDDKPLFDDGCGCSTAHPPASGPVAFGLWIVLGGLAAQRRRAAMGPTRRSAKSSV